MVLFWPRCRISKKLQILDRYPAVSVSSQVLLSTQVLAHCKGHKLLAAFVKTNHRTVWIVVGVINIQNIFHPRDKFHTLSGRNSPLPPTPGLELVCFTFAPRLREKCSLIPNLRSRPIGGLASVNSNAHTFQAKVLSNELRLVHLIYAHIFIEVATVAPHFLYTRRHKLATNSSYC